MLPRPEQDVYKSLHYLERTHTMSNQTIQDSELETIENQYWIDLADALRRLEDNKDFQKLILEGYFTDKAVNGVSMLAARSTKLEGRRPEIMEELNAISQLQDFLITVKNLGTIPEYVEDDEPQTDN